MSVSDDPETQFRDTFKFVAMHLEAAGLHFSDIVEMTSYHVGLRKHLNTFIKIKDEFVRAPYPAWTAIGVAELITEARCWRSALSQNALDFQYAASTRLLSIR